ncbi:hypothetical protein POSPLADRAFT_1117085, partial [Postia placenta MAD-698-R-SB12]
RTREHTQALVAALDLVTLWEDYGIVGDIIPFTNDFPRADINQLMTPDLLHQIIKGTFYDHLVTWVHEYLVLEHGESEAKKILDEIDRRIAAVPPFSGLRRFPEGRDFKQWTGDDSKALMKVRIPVTWHLRLSDKDCPQVYLPAIAGLVPADIVRTSSAFLEFCYLVRRSTLTERTLREVSDALGRFHDYRKIFETTGVRSDGFSLPRQHSLDHYLQHSRKFGAPNGLCSSITESKHIKAVKEPWRRSNRFEALGQMLLTNQRLDKLSAAREDFSARGMLHGTVLTEALHERERPALEELVSRFLFEQTHRDDPNAPNAEDVPLADCPIHTGRVYVVHSASATFYAPSDLSSIAGMRRERIRATPSWRSGPGRYDCVFVNNNDADGFRGLLAARVRLFFSFTYEQVKYPCALVEWFSPVSQEPDDDTGMWIVEPDFDEDGRRSVSVI